MSYHYAGLELTLFAAATNWQAYAEEVLNGHIAGRVLEVAAGIGGNTGHCDNARVSEWSLLDRFTPQQRANYLANVYYTSE